MKKTELEKKYMKLIIIFSTFCLFLFSGCGVQEYFELSAPVAYHVPYAPSDYASRYFEFRSASNSDSGEFNFLGTAVYYKIYSSYSSLASHNSAISTVNTKTNGTAAARRVTETYSYQQLGTSSGGQTPFIPDNGSQTIDIRLSTYGNSSDYASKVVVDSVVQSWKPVRYDNTYTFEFGRTDSSKYSNYAHNTSPSIGDDDVYGSSVPSDGIWYVNMYAISVARDASYSNYYSLVTHLGYITIDSKLEDN